MRPDTLARACILVGAMELLTSSAAIAAVGATAGTAGVTRQGAATYDIQLTLPPDRLMPSLGISYSHMRSNGLLGMGFALNGFSTIQRCSRTVAQDGVASPVIGVDQGDDGYCVDGNRLRLASGTYGQPNSTYRTEVETFMRVTAHGSSSEITSWTAETRDGLVQEFGATTDSRIVPPGGTRARLWALSRIRDRVGNHVDFRYEREPQNGTYRPSEVTYAGNSAQGIAPSTRVTFVYETATRVDPIYQYRLGGTGIGSGTIVESKRLDRIEVVHIATSEVVRTYELTYEANGGAGSRARLSSVQECSAGDCFPATSFQWSNGTSSWLAEVATGHANPAPQSALVMDFDNDGQEDILYPSAAGSGAGTWLVMRGGNSGLQAPLNTTAPNWNHSAAQVIEWDGDGLPDLLVPCSSGTNWCVFYQRTGTAPNRVFVSTPLDTGIAIAQPGTTLASQWLAADINGDGKSDLVRMAKPASGNHFIAVRIRSGTGFQAEVTAYVASGVVFLDGFQALIRAKNRSSARRIDFDGDGREDFYLYCDTPIGGTAIFTAFDSASSSHPFYVQYTGSVFSEPFMYPGDFNGDGLTDLAYAVDGYGLQVYYGNGYGLAPQATVGPSLDDEGAVIAIADVDADGRSDILATHSAFPTWVYSRSFGNSLGALQNTGLSAAGTGSAVVADVNGDGLPDLVRTDFTASNQWKVRLHAGAVPDLLDRVTDGLGNFVDFDYRSTGRDDPFYTPLAVSPTYPARSYSGPMMLAERFTANDGVGGSYVVRFEYKGGVLDMQGRGFQGFAERTLYDSRDTRVVREILKTAFPYNGRVEREEVSAAGRNVHVKQSSHSLHTYGSGFAARYFPFVASEAVDRYGDSGGVIQRIAIANTVDTWGTTTDQTVTLEEVSGGLNTGAVHTRRTWHTLVTNDQANWCLGKPTQTLQINSHTMPGGAPITRTTNNSWDTALCRLTGTVVEPGDSRWQVSTAYSYDDFGNTDQVIVTPAVGQGQAARTTRVDWGASGRFPQSVTNPLSHVTAFTWDVRRGLRTGVTTPNGHTQTSQFDALGRMTRVVNLDGTANDLVLSWCTTGACQGSDTNIRILLQEIARTTANAEIRQVRRYLDAYGREILTQSQLLDGSYTSSRRVFDARGLVRQTSRPFTTAGTEAYETVTYDHLGRPTLIRRPTSASDPSNHDVQLTYEDYRTTSTDALGRTSISHFDAAGQIIRKVDAASGATEYEYDAFGNLLRTRDPLGSVVALAYNVRGMKVSSDDPDMGRWTYDYFPLGEMKSQTDAKNQVTTFTYDALSRPLTRSIPEGSGSITSTFAWGNSSAANNIGQLEWTQVAGTNVTTYRETYAYDAAERLSQTTHADGSTNHFFNYAYNASTGLLEEIAYPTSTSGFRFRVRYDYQHGLPYRVWNAENNDQFWIANAMDALGNVTQATLGEANNGVTFQSVSSFDRVTGALTSRQSTFNSGTVSGTVIANLGFLYDKVGNLIQRQDNQQGLTENFYYDSLYRLDYSTLGTATTDYSYDARGNLTAKSGIGTLYSYTATVAGCSYYSHAQVHAVRRITGGSATRNFCYDANGNMTNRDGTAIAWFADNLPKSITKDASNSSAFEYTPSGQRWRHVYRADGSTYAHTYFGALAERVVGPTTTDWKHYVHVNGEAIAVYIRKTSGAKSRYFFTKDHLGSIAAITHSDGAWRVHESFDGFGRRRGTTWAGSPSSGDLANMNFTTRRGFTAHEHLDSTDLIHMNGRVYDPAIARFVSPDPFVQAPYFSQGLNRYTYALNNPLRYTDPSGYFWDNVFGRNLFGIGDLFGWGRFFSGLFGGRGRGNGGPLVNGPADRNCTGRGLQLRCEPRPVPPPAAPPEVVPPPPATPPAPPPAPPAPPPPRPTPPAPTPTPPVPDPTPTTVRDDAPASTVSAPDYVAQSMVLEGTVVMGLPRASFQHCNMAACHDNSVPPHEIGFMNDREGREFVTSATAEVAMTMAAWPVRAATLIPKVANPKLLNIVNDLYKGARGRNPIGSGSTADAIRNELATGVPTHGVWHSDKGRQYIRALEKWLNNNPNADYHDRVVAESLKMDLEAALQGL